MRLWILSDLHLEYADLRAPLAIPEADVCVVAGDLCRAPANGVHWLAKHIAPALPCVYVAGNHEFYKGSVREGIEDGRRAAEQFPNVHFLENDTITIGSVRFIGCTLWTDYRIEGHQQLAMTHARERMNDHRQIALQRNPWMRFLPTDAYRLHQDSRRFIEASLAAANGLTVVVTHHLPHAASIPTRFQGDLINAAYASDLSGIIEAGSPTLWIHGHTHDSCDYLVSETRVMCNPRGYDDENAKFDQSLVMAIGEVRIRSEMRFPTAALRPHLSRSAPHPAILEADDHLVSLPRSLIHLLVEQSRPSALGGWVCEADVRGTI